jgi:Mg/Co/Ni transporter MgtE
LSRTRQFQVGLVLRQPSQTVGAWMDTVAPPVPSDATMAAIRPMLARDTPVPTHLFVVDGDRRLIGSLAVSAVLAAEDEARVDEICTLGGPSLRANAGLDTAIADPGWQDHDELPVIDHAERFVGAVRFARLRQALAESRPDERPMTPARSGSIMDIVNLCFIGMARAIDASIARRRFDAPPRKEDL